MHADVRNAIRELAQAALAVEKLGRKLGYHENSDYMVAAKKATDASVRLVEQIPVYDRGR